MKNISVPSVELVANQATTVYTVPNVAGTANVSFNILNPTTLDPEIKVAISRSDTPAAADFIEGPLLLSGAGSILERTDLKMTAGEKLIVISSQSGVTVRVWGEENPSK